jgi:hypothetical protein
MASSSSPQEQQQLPPTAAAARARVAAASSSVLATHVEPADDMVAERARASFPPATVAAFLHGGADKLERM